VAGDVVCGGSGGGDAGKEGSIGKELTSKSADGGGALRSGDVCEYGAAFIC